MEDDVQIYDSVFALVAKSDDDEDAKVTILDIKENLEDYSLKELRSLVVVLKDSMCEIIKVKDLLNKKIDEPEIENVELIEQMSNFKKVVNPFLFGMIC